MTRLFSFLMVFVMISSLFCPVVSASEETFGDFSDVSDMSDEEFAENLPNLIEQLKEKYNITE